MQADQELDCAHALPGKARFRLNVYIPARLGGGGLPAHPQEIKPLEAPRHPGPGERPGRLPRGFVLVTGPTGSGESIAVMGAAVGGMVIAL